MSFIRELRRRKVLRTTIAYVVAAWVLVEAGDVLLPAFNAPDWAIRALVLTLAGGLPLMLVLSWLFEITPEGIRREDNKDTAVEARFKARTDRKLDIGIIVVLGLLVSYFVLDKIWSSDLVRGDELRSIAVLPFTDISSRGDQAYFAEGLAIELLNLLSRSTDLRVIGKTSAFQFKDHQGDFRTIGRTLGVGTLLEGSVRAVDNNMRIAIQLVDAEDGNAVWSANYDRKLTNIFQVQDEIARAVVDSLEATLLGGGTEQAEREVVPEAYRAYQQGSFLQSAVSVEAQNSAIDYFKKALEIDPDYPEPMVGLANANLMLALNFAALDAETGISRAQQHIGRALALDDGQADAFVARALIKQVASRDYVGAELDLKNALEIDPNHITALRRLGTIYGRYGRYDEAMGAFQRIVDRDPLNHLTYSNYSLNALAAGNVELAEEMINKVLEFKPDSGFANYQLAKVLLAQDNVDAARKANARETVPIWQTIGEGMIACKAGNEERAEEVADELIAAGELFNAAEIYGLCRDTEKVFEILEQAVAAEDPVLIEMKLSWQLAYLRDDPRWHAILTEVGLPI